MFMTGQWQLQSGMARALRLAFQHNDQFRWDPADTLSKIFIYDSFPLVGMRLPAVIITMGGGPGLLRGIGDEFAYQEGTDVSVSGLSHTQVSTLIYSGNIELTTNIRVMARSGFERAQIADWIVLFLRFFAKDKFANEGIQLRDIQLGPQDEELIGSDPVYRCTVSVRSLCALTREVSVSQSETLDAICLTGVFTTLDGATVGDSPA